MTNKPIDRSWSRKKITDKWASAKTQSGKPMSRQQAHMMRKRSEGKCLTCSESVAVITNKRGRTRKSPYCIKHLVKARERMREKMKYNRRLKTPSYELQEGQAK